LALSQFVQGSRLGQGKWTAEKTFIQETEMPGVEAAKSTYGSDAVA